MSQNKKKVCVVGLGYIGLPTSALLASRGYSVHGVDLSSKVVETINRGEIHIVEPDLDVFVRAAVDSGRLKAGTEPAHADIFIICVPTPFITLNSTDIPKPDMSYVISAAKSIAPFIKSGNIVILESTSPIGSTEQVCNVLQSSGVNVDDIAIAYCPERVLPGKIMHELVNNDRIVGGINQKSANIVCEFYNDFVNGKVIPTNARTAEMAKLAENSFRDVNIAFANEISILCDQHQINVWELITLANRHPRVNILQPGPGVGGHCISVDPWFLVHSDPKSAKLIHTARIVNDSKPQHVINKVKKALSGLNNPTISFFGLSFKANIDDLRESPALTIIESFAKMNVAQVLAVEPNIQKLPSNLTELGVQLTTVDEAIEKSDIVVLLVDHNEFKHINKKLIDSKIVVDTRGIWS